MGQWCACGTGSHSQQSATPVTSAQGHTWSVSATSDQGNQQMSQVERFEVRQVRCSTFSSSSSTTACSSSLLLVISSSSASASANCNSHMDGFSSPAGTGKDKERKVNAARRHGGSLCTQKQPEKHQDTQCRQTKCEWLKPARL